MEYALPELLTHNELLRILNERQLKIEQLESLSNAELLRIYKSFAVPLAKRACNRPVRISNQISRAPKRPNVESMEIDAPPSKFANTAQLSLQIACTVQNNNKQCFADDLEHNTFTKRVKLHSA